MTNDVGREGARASSHLPDIWEQRTTSDNYEVDRDLKPASNGFQRFEQDAVPLLWSKPSDDSDHASVVGDP